VGWDTCEGFRHLVRVPCERIRVFVPACAQRQGVFVTDKFEACAGGDSTGEEAVRGVEGELQETRGQAQGGLDHVCE
jgi:hypothetical protein